jgi:hypothetical protein
MIAKNNVRMENLPAQQCSLEAILNLWDVANVQVSEKSILLGAWVNKECPHYILKPSLGSMKLQIAPVTVKQFWRMWSRFPVILTAFVSH